MPPPTLHTAEDALAHTYCRPAIAIYCHRRLPPPSYATAVYHHRRMPPPPPTLPLPFPLPHRRRCFRRRYRHLSSLSATPSSAAPCREPPPFTYSKLSSCRHPSSAMSLLPTVRLPPHYPSLEMTLEMLPLPSPLLPSPMAPIAAGDAMVAAPSSFPMACCHSTTARCHPLPAPSTAAAPNPLLLCQSSTPLSPPITTIHASSPARDTVSRCPPVPLPLSSPIPLAAAPSLLITIISSLSQSITAMSRSSLAAASHAITFILLIIGRSVKCSLLHSSHHSALIHHHQAAL